MSTSTALNGGKPIERILNLNEQEEYEIAAIPEWALCYLEYGDTDGLTLEDIALANEFKADYCLVAHCGGEHYFTRFPAFGAPATVEDWKVRLRA